jgi:inner membrane protein
MHTTAGYIVYRIFRNRLPQRFSKSIWRIPFLLLIFSIFAMLPDIDSVVGIITGDIGRYHNNATHSLFVGLFISLAFSGVVSLVGSFKFRDWFFVMFLSYSLHVVLDFFTVGRGVMAFWPLSQQRFLSPLSLFYGLHWSDGFISIRHVWTFLTESAIVALFVLATHYLASRKWDTAKHQGGARKAVGPREER